jgi:hypothetical protein
MGLDDPSFIRSKTPEEAWALHYGHSLTYWDTKLWTIRHGYRLLRLPSEEVPGRVPLWSKIPPMLRMTKDRSCDVSGSSLGVVWTITPCLGLGACKRWVCSIASR